VGEITLVEELGKISPYVRKKESLTRAAMFEEAAESRLGRLFSKNTGPCKLV